MASKIHSFLYTLIVIILHKKDLRRVPSLTQIIQTESCMTTNMKDTLEIVTRRNQIFLGNGLLYTILSQTIQLLCYILQLLTIYAVIS